MASMVCLFIAVCPLRSSASVLMLAISSFAMLVRFIGDIGELLAVTAAMLELKLIIEFVLIERQEETLEIFIYQLKSQNSWC